MKDLPWFVNVNKQAIARNIRAEPGTEEPPVRISRGKSGAPVYCMECELPAGSRVIYEAKKPVLNCGARLVIACPTEPRVIR